MDYQLWAFIIIAIIVIYMIFSFTSATVDEYIAEGITQLSEYLKLSDAMAAVTLIAIANGAGDVITALVASGSAGGVSYNIGSLFGSGYFVCALVIAGTTLIQISTMKNKQNKSPSQANEQSLQRTDNQPLAEDKECQQCQDSSEKQGQGLFVQVSPEIIFRDVGFYILSTVVIIIFAITGKVTWYYCIILLLIYVALIVVVKIQDIRENKKIKKKEEDRQHQQEDYKVKSQKGAALWKKVKAKQKAVQQFKEVLTVVQFRKQQFEERRKEREDTFANKSIFGKITTIVDFIPGLARKVTMTPCQQEDYNKWIVFVQPFFMVTFVYWAFGFYQKKCKWWYLLYIGLPIAIVLSMTYIVTHYFLEKEQKNKKTEEKQEQLAPKKEDEEEEELPLVPKYYLAMNIVSACLGLLWTYVVIAILIDLLNGFIVIFKLDDTFMGLTILGCGNSLPDALTTIALAKQGYAIMGICGAYSGQLFGLLIGFGLAQLKTTLINGYASPFDLFKDPEASMLDIVVIFFCFGTLVVTFLYSIKTKYRFNQILAIILLAAYGAFFIVAVAIQVYFLATGKS